VVGSNQARPLVPSIKSHLWKILSTFGDKYSQNGSKYGSVAPSTGLGCPLKGPSVAFSYHDYCDPVSTIPMPMSTTNTLLGAGECPWHGFFQACPLTLHPAPSTLNPAPSTLYPQPCTLNPPPSTLHPAPSTLNPAPSTLNPAPSTLYPQPCTLSLNPAPSPSTLHHQPCTLNPAPSTLNP